MMAVSSWLALMVRAGATAATASGAMPSAGASTGGGGSGVPG